MTLHVSLEQFTETAKRVLGHGDAYIHTSHHGTSITAVHQTLDRIVSCWTPLSVNDVRKRLEKEGVKLFDGVWAHDGEIPSGYSELASVHIAAVSYRGEGEQPGVWIDAFEAQPTQVQVLKGLYEEFKSTGEMPEVSFEEFVRLAKPNVVIASPAEIAGYLEAKEPGC